MTNEAGAKRLVQPRQKTVFLLFFLLGLFAYLGRIWWIDDGKFSLYDDAFISFRYALNLAEGEGLVFNPGERVEGYTNYLWTLLIAAAIKLGADAVLAAKVLGIIIGAFILVATVLLARALVAGTGPWIVIPALMLAATASLPRYAVSGMETLLFSLWLCLGSFFLFSDIKSWGIWLAGLSFALAALTRPEGVLFFGLVITAWTIEERARSKEWAPPLRNLLYSVGIFAAILVPHIVWRYSYYGFWLPNSFYAKVGGINPAAWTRGLIYLRNELLILNLPLVIWTVIGTRSLKGRGIPTLYTALIGYFTYLLIIGGDDWAVFGPRFILAVVPWMVVIGFAGVVEMTRSKLFLRATVCIAVIGLIVGLSAFELNGYRGVIRTMNRGWWATANWLSQKASPDEVIAVDAAGIIPYHTRMPSLDMLGLNDIHIAHLTVEGRGPGLAGHEKHDPDYILGRRPAYIASWLDPQGNPISAGLEDHSAEVFQDYELTAVFLMGIPTVDHPSWLELGGEAYSESLSADGYIYGVFSRIQKSEP